MKVIFRILLVLLIAGAIGGYIYWQGHKKSIVNNAIQNALKVKSDSLYFIHYDSSQIDEVKGNASFYKITLQSDSIQKKVLQSTDSLPNVLYNIRAQEVTARGINIPGLLTGHQVTAQSITILQPVIQIINTGADKPKPFTLNDTMELYKKILGSFKSISADTIQVIKGTVLITDKKGKALTTLENINISLNHFLVDSTKDYQNIISYFIKDVKVMVENIQLPESAEGNRINLTNLVYDAPAKTLQLSAIRQYKQGNMDAIVDIKNVHVTQLNTDAFILFQQLKAGLVSADGGLITVYKKSKKLHTGEEAIVLSNDVIDEAMIGGIQLGKTKVVVVNTTKPGQAPFVINDVTFKASNIASNTNGGTLTELVSNADWELSAAGFSFFDKSKMYQFVATGLQLNNKMGTVKVNRFLYKPLVSEQQFAKIHKIQTDRYDLNVSNINLAGVNFKQFISNNQLEMEEASLTPVLKIFNDRTLIVDTSSTLGKYPHQSLLKLPFHFYIKKVAVINGGVFYKERGHKSEKTGTVGFTGITAQVYNVTNIAEKIRANGMLQLNASATFLHAGKLVTEWRLPLSKADTAFTVKGSLTKMDATILNSITEPLAMASVKKGTINGLVFNFKGNDYKATGNTTFLYNDLNVAVLKLNNNDELKKRGLLSVIVNTLIANDNPKNGNTYEGQIDFSRDMQKSFFNLLWKSIFDGVKKTVQRK